MGITSRVHGQDQALPYTAATPRLCKRTTKPLAWKPLWEGSCSLPLAVCCSCIHQKKTLFSFPHDVLLLGCVWRGHRQRQQGSALGNVITSFFPLDFHPSPDTVIRQVRAPSTLLAPSSAQGTPAEDVHRSAVPPSHRGSGCRAQMAGGQRPCGRISLHGQRAEGTSNIVTNPSLLQCLTVV